MNKRDAIAIALAVFGRDSLDLLKRNFPCTPGTRGHAIVYAENAQGETVGKRDPGPWCEYLPQGVHA